MVNVSGWVVAGVPVVLPGVVLTGAAKGSGMVVAGVVGVPLAGVPGPVGTCATAAVEPTMSIDSNSVFMTFGIDESKVRPIMVVLKSIWPNADF